MAEPLSFDDLMPGGGQSGGVTFDDLVPAKPNDRRQEIYDQAYPPGSLGRSFADLTDVSMDALTRGFGSKLFGDQERVAQAKENLPAAAEIPAEIAGSVVGSPYRVGGALAGAGIGALEGAASAYGHQKDWVPDLQGGIDIAKGAGVGAVAGGGGAKLGEWGSDIYSRLANTRVPNPTAGDPNLLGKVGNAVAPISFYGNRSWRNAPIATAADLGLSHLGLPPVTTGAATLATGLNWLGKTGLGRQGAEMAAPAATDAARDALAKMLIGMSK